MDYRQLLEKDLAKDMNKAMKNAGVKRKTEIPLCEDVRGSPAPRILLGPILAERFEALQPRINVSL